MSPILSLPGERFLAFVRKPVALPPTHPGGTRRTCSLSTIRLTAESLETPISPLAANCGLGPKVFCSWQELGAVLLD
jgi:hypothetical protein